MSSSASRFSLLGFVVLTLMTAGLFSGCTTQQKSEDAQDQAPGMAIEKKGDTSLTGKLTKKSGKYFLERTGKQPQEVDSYKVDLSTYIDKSVTITGQFSGETLFAGKVEIQ